MSIVIIFRGCMHESAKMENLNVLLAQILWGGEGV